MSNQIRHKGVIERIEGSCITVRIEQIAACAACAAQRYCNSSEKKEKMVEILHTKAEYFQVGQHVEVYGSLSTGMRAVWFAYSIPLLLLLCTLFIVLFLTHNEPLAALVALAVLIPYYTGLYYFRERLKSKFTFTITTT